MRNKTTSKFLKIVLIVGVLASSACASNTPIKEVESQNLSSGMGDTIPEPDSWSFPAVIESARKISPKNIEGREFNRFGLAYSSEELSQLDVANLPAEKLQNYADIVTHAFPDAVFRQAPGDCSKLPFNQMNETSVAGIAYVSINAVEKETRDRAAVCFKIVQSHLK